MATFEEEYKKYSTSGQGQAINDMYDAQKQSQLTQLERTDLVFPLIAAVQSLSEKVNSTK